MNKHIFLLVPSWKNKKALLQKHDSNLKIVGGRHVMKNRVRMKPLCNDTILWTVRPSNYKTLTIDSDGWWSYVGSCFVFMCLLCASYEAMV